MNKMLMASLLFIFSLGAAAQELVIFKSDRALEVQSHRKDGNWTYLRIGGGEMAVLTQDIRSIVSERVTARPSPAPAPAGATPTAEQGRTEQPPMSAAPPPSRPGVPIRQRMMPPGQAPPESMTKPSDEDEDEGDAEADEEDPGDVQEGQPQPEQPEMDQPQPPPIPFTKQEARPTPDISPADDR